MEKVTVLMVYVFLVSCKISVPELSNHLYVALALAVTDCELQTRVTGLWSMARPPDTETVGAFGLTKTKQTKIFNDI